MAKARIIALSNARDGQDETYLAWYREHHLGDLKAIDGVLTGDLHESAHDGARWRYMGVYTVDDDTIAGVLAAIAERRGTELMPMTDAIDSSSVAFLCLETLEVAGSQTDNADFRLLTLAAPADGLLADLDTWYKEQHIPDMLAIDGFHHAAYHGFGEGTRGTDAAWMRAGLYEAHGDDGSAILARIGAAASSGAMRMSPALDRSAGYTHLYRRIG